MFKKFNDRLEKNIISELKIQAIESSEIAIKSWHSSRDKELHMLLKDLYFNYWNGN